MCLACWRHCIRSTRFAPRMRIRLRRMVGCFFSLLSLFVFFLLISHMHLHTAIQIASSGTKSMNLGDFSVLEVEEVFISAIRIDVEKLCGMRALLRRILPASEGEKREKRGSRRERDSVLSSRSLPAVVQHQRQSAARLCARPNRRLFADDFLRHSPALDGPRSRNSRQFSTVSRADCHSTDGS